MNKHGVFLALLLLALLSSVASPAAGPPQAPYRQDYLVLGFWGDPPVDRLVNERYAAVDMAHFNVVLGGMGADTPDKARNQRDACKKYDLKVIFSTYGLPVDQLCNCETTYGFLVRDHPATVDFPTVKARVDEIRRLRPGKLPFVNLFPSTASPKDMGADSYDSYVNQFVETFHPEVLCFDNYPPFLPEKDGRAVFCENLVTIRSAALRENIPFWCFVKAMAYGSDAVPAESQIRWQVYAALAHGAKGILYSCYATPPTGGDFVGTGIIGSDDKPTERYAQVTRMNLALKNLGRTLMGLASTGVWHVAAGSPSPADLPVALTPKSPGDELLVGAFRHEDGRAAVLIVNYRDRGEEAVVTLSAAAPGSTIMEVSRDTGKTEAAIDADPSVDGLQLTFAPGDGRLLLVEQ